MAAEPFFDNQGIDQTPLAAIWRFRWLVLALTLGGGLLALLVALATFPPRYEATASLVVTDPRASTLFSAAEATSLNSDRYVADQKAILGSYVVAERASELLAQNNPDSVQLPKEIAENLEIETSNSNEILVQYTALDRPTAIATANAITQAYELVRGEAAARDSASGVAQLDRSISDIDTELASIQQQILAARDNPTWVALNGQYEEALLRLSELQSRLGTSNEATLARLQAEIAVIDEQLSRFDGIIRIQASDPTLIQLNLEQNEAVSRRSALAEERDRLLVDTELLSGGITLSSPAQFAEVIRTDIAVTVLGAALGLFAGTGIAYLLAQRRRKFVERAQPGWILETAMLAEIPNFGDEGLASEVPVFEHPASISAEAFRFAATTLDLQLTQHDDADIESSVHTFLLTSAGPGDGKTVLAANIALAAARKGRTVLAIDADFGNQKLSELLGGTRPPGAPGITEVVEAGAPLDTALFSLGPPGTLDLLSRGSRPVTAPDFFSLPATRAFIERVGQQYDLVLIDGPPMLHVAYASTLARYVDRVMVVVQHGSGVKQLEDLSQRLDLIGTQVAGYIYNAAPLRYEMTLTEGSLKDVLGHDVPIDVPQLDNA